MTRKFYKTTFQVEVLSEDLPLDENIELCDLDYDITYGDYSGKIKRTEVKELTAKEVVQELKVQGSEPGFFNLDDNGNEQ